MKLLALTALPLSILFACGEKESDTSETTDTAEETTEDTGEETTEDTGEETTEDTGEEPTEPAPEAFVRVVHLSPDAPAVDVYANGAAVVNDAAFPGGTGYLNVPVGDYTFEVAPAGTTADDVLSVNLSATLEADTYYTAIAHGYLDTANGDNGFAITPFVQDMSEITEGNFRVQVVHGAAGLGQVDIWNITDSANPTPLIENFDYGAEVTTELPTGVAFVLGVDVDDDATPDVTFNIPDSLTGFVGVYAANETDGTPFLFAHLEDGTTVRLDPAE